MTLFVEFQMGDDGYLLNSAEVVQVLPLVAIKRIPHAPRGVAGSFYYRGISVPVIDLSELATGASAQRHLSTRLILVRYRDHAGRDQLLGLIAEKVTQTVRVEPVAFVASGIVSSAAPYLGSVSIADSRLLQRIEVQQLLTAEVSEVLFRQTEEDAWSSLESKRC